MKKQRAFIVAASLVLLSATILLLKLDYERKTNAYLKNNLDLLGSTIEATTQTLGQFSRFVVSREIVRPEITSLMEKAWNGDVSQRDSIRETLRNRITNLYALLLTYNFRQLHFQLPDNTSFLRMQSPDKFGDDLTAVRPTISHANATRLPVIAFEEGRIYNGFRFVYPLFHQGTHCGSVELSFSMGSYIDILSRLGTVDYYFGIRKEVADRTLFPDEKERYVESSFSPLFLFDREILPTSDHNALFRENAERLDSILKSDEDGGFIALFEGHPKTILVKQIRNMEGRAVACLISISENATYEHLESNFNLLLAVTIVVFLLLTLAVFILIFERDELKRLSRTDFLTGLSNRIAVVRDMEHEIINSRRYGHPLSVLMIDIDHFKRINDSYGHGEGDEVLRRLSRLMRETLRAGDNVGRWGGEEFLAVLPNTPLASAIAAAEKLRKNIEESVPRGRGAVTVSIGVAEYQAGDEIEKLVARADAALYEAKAKGRNRVAA